MRKLLSASEDGADFSAIIEWIRPQSSVLDLGCGTGDLLDRLRQERGVRGMGVDIDAEKIVECIQKGIPVVQTDLNLPLDGFETGSYDYVILSQTIHQVAQPDRLMQEILRIGRNAIVSFPNFGHLSLRLQLLLSGKMPKSTILPFEWYRTPNIHLMTLADFESFCDQLGIQIVDRFFVRNGRHYRRLLWANLRAEAAVLQLGCRGCA